MYINTSLSQRLDRETDRQTNRQAGRQTGTVLPLRNPHVKSWADRHTHLVTYSGDTCSQPRLPTEQAAQMEGPPQAQTLGTGFPTSEPDADATDWAAPGKQSLEALPGEGV